jgi:hypothetical protein
MQLLLMSGVGVGGVGDVGVDAGVGGGGGGHHWWCLLVFVNRRPSYICGL